MLYHKSYENNDFRPLPARFVRATHTLRSSCTSQSLQQSIPLTLLLRADEVALVFGIAFAKERIATLDVEMSFQKAVRVVDYLGQIALHFSIGTAQDGHCYFRYGWDDHRGSQCHNTSGSSVQDIEWSVSQTML